jgi:hypothetical protein
MKSALTIFLLVLAVTLKAQLPFAIETILNKDTASQEFRTLMTATKMEELTDWQRSQNGVVIEKWWAFKSTDSHVRVKVAKNKTGNSMHVQQLTLYNPDKNSPKIKSNIVDIKLPFGLNWNMTQPDVKKIIGTSNDAWVRYQAYEVQCSGFTASANYKMNTIHIRPATQYVAPAVAYVEDAIPDLMTKIIQSAQNAGLRLDRKETVSFQPNQGDMKSYKEITFTIPKEAKFYMMYINLEHTIGGNVYIKDQMGNFYPCNLMPGNADFLQFAPATFPPEHSGKTLTIYVTSENTSVHSKISVYYFREKY